jgi:hypothetical protein
MADSLEVATPSFGPFLTVAARLRLLSPDLEGGAMARGRPPNSMKAAVAPVHLRGAGPQACGVDTRVDAPCLMDARVTFNGVRHGLTGHL